MKASSSRLRIGIIGGGFSGTAFAATCHRLFDRPVDIYLFEKTGQFGKGEAYRTPFPYHLLNVRAKNMSAFEEDSQHFVNWVQATQQTNGRAFLSEKTLPFNEQFLPRVLYADYLQDLLKTIQQDSSGKINLHLDSSEVIDVILQDREVVLVLNNQRTVTVDKVILALGNGQPSAFPFPVSQDMACITNPWDYASLKHIGSHDPVFIVGTGLSMIDAVLTLHHHQHQGNIYAVSRHGLLPLPHHHLETPCVFDDAWPSSLKQLTKRVRSMVESHLKTGGDWRSIVNGVRLHIPTLWENASEIEKKRFLRHVLPYWNIHRHRVHDEIANLLARLQAQQQLHILSGRVVRIENQMAMIRSRHQQEYLSVPAKWVINCMGPSMYLHVNQPPLLHSLLQKKVAMLDPLNLGLASVSSGALKLPSGDISSMFYALGPLRKGMLWESTAVPDIRQQCLELVRHLASEARA